MTIRVEKSSAKDVVTLDFYDEDEGKGLMVRLTRGQYYALWKTITDEGDVPEATIGDHRAKATSAEPYESNDWDGIAAGEERDDTQFDRLLALNGRLVTYVLDHVLDAA